MIENADRLYWCIMRGMWKCLSRKDQRRWAKDALYLTLRDFNPRRPA